jgi:hypothetical protein
MQPLRYILPWKMNCVNSFRMEFGGLFYCGNEKGAASLY